MSSFVEIAGNKYESVSAASKQTGYSRDYIGRLAREEKITATQVGRQWFVSVASLEAYAKNAEHDQKARKEKLSLQRKQEREAIKSIHVQERAKVIAKQKKQIGQKVLAGSVLTFGVGLGVFLNATFFLHTSPLNQAASAPEVGSFRTAEQEFPVATGDTVEQISLETIDFSQESMSVSTLDGDGEGVLLLPNQADKKLTEAEVKKLFSDPVQLVKDEEGNQYVVRQTAEGKEERLPFVVVPVANKQTP